MSKNIINNVSRGQSTKSYLFTLLAKTYIGDVASIVLSTLISHGRLTAKEISARSKISLKLTKTALVTLIQLNCIFHWEDKKQRNVYYSFREEGLLIILHSGEIIQHIEKNYGEQAAQIVQNILQVGHLQISDYLQSFDNPEESNSQQMLIIELFREGWLRRQQKHDIYPLVDIWNELYQESLSKVPPSATTSEIKRVNEAKEHAKFKFLNLLDPNANQLDLYEIRGGIKFLNPSVVITFNLARFEKYIRHKEFVNFARSRIGVLSASVFETALSIIEQNSPDVKHPLLQIGILCDPDEEKHLINSIENKLVDDKKIVFNVHDVAKKLPADLDLENSILTHNFLKPAVRKRQNDSVLDPSKKIKLENSMSDIFNLGEHSLNEEASEFTFEEKKHSHSINIVTQHLKLLASNKVAFLSEISPGTYTVPYSELMKELKSYTYEMMIKATIGSDAFKILRCIKSLKLVDEKTVSNTVLLKEKTVRNVIFKLTKLNILEIQEIPRSADRAASKTFYLLRHHEFGAYKSLSNSLIFCMAEIIFKIKSIELENKILLDKCERDDVKGKEKDLLLESELKILHDLQDRTVRNIGKLNRLKSLFVIYDSF